MHLVDGGDSDITGNEVQGVTDSHIVNQTGGPPGLLQVDKAAHILALNSEVVAVLIYILDVLQVIQQAGHQQSAGGTGISSDDIEVVLTGDVGIINNAYELVDIAGVTGVALPLQLNVQTVLNGEVTVVNSGFTGVVGLVVLLKLLLLNVRPIEHGNGLALAVIIGVVEAFGQVVIHAEMTPLVSSPKYALFVHEKLTL